MVSDDHRHVLEANWLQYGDGARGSAPKSGGFDAKHPSHVWAGKEHVLLWPPTCRQCVGKWVSSMWIDHWINFARVFSFEKSRFGRLVSSIYMFALPRFHDSLWCCPQYWNSKVLRLFPVARRCRSCGTWRVCAFSMRYKMDFIFSLTINIWLIWLTLKLVKCKMILWFNFNCTLTRDCIRSNSSYFFDAEIKKEIYAVM